MREIKFRAWYNEGKGIFIWEDSLTDWINHWSNKGLINSLIFNQYTGLQDKFGRDIYEGDIYNQGDKNIKYKVIFEDGCFIGNQIGNKSLSGLKHFIKDIEVIGNIYENKELLTN